MGPYHLITKQIFPVAKNGEVKYEARLSFPDSEDVKNFRKNIGIFNNLFAFASTKMTPAKDLPVKKFGSGVIRISGQIYHKTGNLYPSKEHEPLYKF